jgi:G3E family GTPase
LIPDARTPVVVVTGFLGSGKTTLVNRLLAQPELAHSFVVVNEFGEVSVDHHLIENAQERTVTLPNGCLCCRLRGDLEETLVGAAMRRRRGEIEGFDRVIVETSGLADPGPVAQTLFADQALARDFKLGPVVTVVDAADGCSFAEPVARAQIAAADVVVLSKTDRADGAQISRAEAEVRRINAVAACIPAAFGEVEPQALLSAHAVGKLLSGAAAHAHGAASFVLRFDAPVARDLLERFLATLVELRGKDLLRVKGVVRLDTGEWVLVQGVRHVFDRLRPVGVGKAGGESALVFISSGVGAGEIESLWQAMKTLHRRES